MKIILVKAYAGTLYSSTNELSWEGKKKKTNPPLRVGIVSALGHFVV